MASANRVTNASLSLTLPISCQICLGKVKEPVVCPNQHVFCSPCLDLWLRTNRYCPTCRTPITHEQPCKKILGSIDLQVNSDVITKAELRRTRLELIRKEYEDDLVALQNTIERLKVENKRLHERLSEQDKTISALHLSVSLNKVKDATGIKGPVPTPDLDMLLKLTAKLQEASVTYEQLKSDMLKTKENNKRLQEENESLLRETTRLKDESLFTKSPQRFSHYSMTAMQTKVTQYEKEIQQLKKALTRSDSFIEELNSKMEGKTPEGRETASSSAAESYQKQASTIDGSRRSSSISLEAVNTNDASPRQPAASDVDNDDNADNDERPTMVNVSNFQCSTALTTLSQSASNTSDILATPLAEAANAIEAADQWLKAASNKTSTSTSLNTPDVFYPADMTTHRLDSKISINNNPVDPFPASRQLMMLSERLSRHRDPTSSTMKIDYVQGSSPSSSDGGKLVPKTLDFADMMGAEGGSMNGDSPRMTPRLETLSPRIDSIADDVTSLSSIASCAFAKIKNETPDSSDDPVSQAKRVKLEKEESSFHFDNN